MEKNPKKLTPEVNNIKTYPGQQLNTGVSPTTTDLLPAIFRTETNSKVLGAIVNDLFQPSSIETLNFAVGRQTSITSTVEYLPHPIARRQLEAGLVVFTETGAETLTSDDVATAWKLNDRVNETPSALSILDLPIDPDKYLNWSNYHWIEQGMPVVFITSGDSESIDVVADVLGKTNYTTPVQRNGRRLTLKNGMRIVFQPHPLQQPIAGDLNLEFTTSGLKEDVLKCELVNYDIGIIGVGVNGTTLVRGTDFEIAGNTIIWTTPVAGQSVYVHLPDYYLTTDSNVTLRRWLVDGVDSEEGIRLLGRTHQNTNTAYSKTTDALWDQTAIPWDRLEWDGLVPGINSKHYILQQAGAANRNAHSRVNVWTHKSAIQQTADFLNISFNDIADANSQALRPIVEFENTLEHYNQGTNYRAWVASIESVKTSPTSYIGFGVRKLNIALGLATTATPAKQLNPAPRVLWLTPGPFQNKIVTFRSNATYITYDYLVETPQDGETTVVSSLTYITPMAEFHWVNGRAIKSTYRLSTTQQPSFELYSKDGIRLSDFQAVTGATPSIVNSNIIKIQSGSTVDLESGYKLNFLPTQFTQLSTSNTAKDSMYNILYNHTQQDFSYYIDGDGNQRTVSGPYSFNRVKGSNTTVNLSNGYRRAWFKLKSWAISTRNIVDGATIQLDATMWPTYDWGIKLVNGQAIVIFADDLSPVVDNYAVGGRGEVITFDIYGATESNYATVNGQQIALINSQLAFTIPADAPKLLLVKIGSLEFKIRIIDIKADPRFIKLSLNGLPISYSIIAGEYAVIVNGTGTLELHHQGNVIADSDHLTAIPGFDYNPEQIPSLGEFSPARVSKGLSRSIVIDSNSNTTTWVKSLDGIYMVEHSAIRSAWANFKLDPGLKDITVSRSLAAWRWYRKFISKLEENNNALNFGNATSALDRILSELLLGVTYSSVDAVSGMAFITSAMAPTTYTAAGQKSFVIGTDITLYTDAYGPDHIYVYVNGSLQLNLVDYTINNTTVSVDFIAAPAAGNTVTIYYAPEVSVYSGIPASPAKLGLGGVFIPGIVTETWGNNSKTFIQRHDGSRITAYVDPVTGVASSDYVINAIILELENRIYNGCLNRVGEANRQRSINNYSADAVSESQARSMLEWMSINSTDYRSRTDYDAQDSWTWNYAGNSWRSLYLQYFKTYSLHQSPWEALGFDDAPVWWDAHYSWTDATKRAALENALRYGITSAPTDAVTTNPDFVTEVESFPVTNTGELLSPFEWGIMAPSSASAQQPWELGSLGPTELAWRRSVAGTWSNILHIIDNYTLVNDFFDNAINPFNVQPVNNSVRPKGYNTIAPSQFFQLRPSVGIGAIIFESYREFNLLGETPLNELMAINPRLEFSMGGFTDGEVSLKMNYTKYQLGNYIPADDFAMTLSKGVPEEKLRYTSVRVERDDTGFRVYGFDPGQRYFKVFTPSANSLTSSYPSTRRQFSTPYGTFNEYLSWDTNVTFVPYGFLIEDKQELITFLMGLGEYQQSCGLVLDQLDTRGNVVNWKQAALDTLTWIEEKWSAEHYCISSVITPSGLKFKHDMGTLDQMDAALGRVGKVMFANGRSALADELLITREFEFGTDKISPITSEQIVFIKFNVRHYDQVFFINKLTKFGDLIADLQTDSRLPVLDLYGRRTYGWTGRPSANGVIPRQTTLVPGFDTLVSDIVTSHMPERVAFDTFKTSIARSDVVPTKKSVIFDIVQDDTSAYLYRQGLQSASGTNLAINALFRNRNIDIPGRTQDVLVNEQWMFNTGNFGRLDGRKVWEIELRKQDITSDRQIIRFKETTSTADIDYRGDNIIDLIGKNDSRWITRPGDATFNTIARDLIDLQYSKANGWLPNAGIAQLLDVDIKALTLTDVGIDNFKSLSKTVNVNGITVEQNVLFTTQSYSRYRDYSAGDFAWNSANLYMANVKITGSETNAFDSSNWTRIAIDGSLLPSIWLSDYDGRGWMVLQVLGQQFIEETCPNAYQVGLNESKVTFAAPHNLVAGESIIITGSGDGNYDTTHVVKEVVDSYNVLIAARSTSDLPIYNMLCFKFGKVKFTSDLAYQSSMITFVPGMKAYIDYEDSDASYKVITFVNDADGINDADGSSITDTVIRYSGPMVDTSSISKIELFDYDNQDLLATVEVFDPFKGLTIDEVSQYIDFKQVVDPASYNVTELGENDDYVAMPWGSDKLGTLWWDLDSIRYIDYEQSDDIQYRASHWGEKFANSTVSVYEWVITDTVPSVDYDVDAKLNTSASLTGQVRYSAVYEVDKVTGATLQKYYYWKRNVAMLPPGAARPYSASSIQSVLSDPDANAVAWASPIATNALLLSNIADFLKTKDRVVLRIEQNPLPEQIHTNAVLVSEGMTGSTINDFLFYRLSASVVGRDNYRETYKIKEYTTSTYYSKGDYIYVSANGSIISTTDYGTDEYPILKQHSDTRYDVSSARTSASGKDHHVYIAVKDFTSTTFDNDKLTRKLIKSATCALIKNLFELDSVSEEYYAVLNTRRRVPDLSLHPLRRNGNGYAPKPQSWFNNIVNARRTLVTAANEYLLNIDVVSKPDWGKYLTTYKPLSGKYEKDLTKYWKYVDYVFAGYSFGNELVTVGSNADISLLDSTVTNFAIVDAAGNTVEAYNKDGNNLSLMYRKNGTIQFLDAVWDGSLGDAWDRGRWDRNAWDEDASEVVESILLALRNSIFTDSELGYFNLVFFALVKESLVQVPNADWVAKTTYLDVAQTSTGELVQVGTYYNKKDSLITSYINEVKPFHSKIVDTSQFNKSLQQVPVTLSEGINLTITESYNIVTNGNRNNLTTETGEQLATETTVTYITLTQESI